MWVGLPASTSNGSSNSQPVEILSHPCGSETTSHYVSVESESPFSALTGVPVCGPSSVAIAEDLCSRSSPCDDIEFEEEVVASHGEDAKGVQEAQESMSRKEDIKIKQEDDDM